MRPETPRPLSRRALLAAGALAPLLAPALAASPARAAGDARDAEGALIRRPIPKSGETLPAMGIGTSRRYEVEPTPDKVAPLEAAVRRFVELGGSVIDTAPSYGTAEDVLGRIFAKGDLREKVFLASKVSASGAEGGRAEIQRSFERMGVDVIDLVAVHNLIDTGTNLATLRDLKARKKIRYVGVTVWRDGQFDGLEPVLRTEPLDFVQVNYAVDNRAAAERVLPLAADKGVAVMVNVPFGRDRLFKAVQGKPVPDFARAFGCETWPQFFLKYVLGHPAVTCPIPGMAKVSYVEDNCAAARGRLPDAAERRQMEAFIDAL
jgi:aryl-alcohol dehydrogenase-like predicted oxidoreductase